MDLILRSMPEQMFTDDVEVVEHKGIGHPDTICDAVAEAFGVGLAQFYLSRFGSLLHFNVDKVLLSGGTSKPLFGAGEVLSPIRVFLGGRATREVRGVIVPVDEIAVESAKAWVRAHLHALDPDHHIAWNCLAGGGSSELVELFLTHQGGKRGAWLSNDTSIGVGYAPPSKLERVVLAAADRLRELARERPEVGEDVKVMGVRRGKRIHLTVACALIGRHLLGMDDYAARRESLARELATLAQRMVDHEVTVEVNAADDLHAGRAYITVTGTSAEAGDDGEVGRGNRVTGLITPYRPMSLEATAGKNPVSHTGKLYNVAAQRISEAIVERVAEVAEAQCFMLSRIGAPVDDPAVVDIRVHTRDGIPASTLRGNISEIVQEQLGALGALTDEILAGKVRLF